MVLQGKEEAEPQLQLAAVEKVPVLPLHVPYALLPRVFSEDSEPGFLLKSCQSPSSQAQEELRPQAGS